MSIQKKPDQSENQSSPKELEIYLRQQKVWDLMLQGFTQDQIAQELGVSTKTIARDAMEIKKDSIRWMDTLPNGQIQTYHRSNFETIEKICRELWNLYDFTVDFKLKIIILKTISEIRKTHSGLMARFDLMKLSNDLHEKLSPSKGGMEFDMFPSQRQEIDFDKIVK